MLKVLLPLSLCLTISARGQPSFRVVSVEPAANSLSASLTTALVVTFDAAIDTNFFDDSTFRVFGRWSGVMTGEFRMEAQYTRLRFIPNRAFSAGERVTVTMARAETAEGARLDTGYAWQFWIRPVPASLDLTQSAVINTRDRSRESWIQSYGAYGGDLNGDGYSDLFVPNERSNDVRVFINDGAGNYDGYTTYPIPDGSRPSPNEGSDFNDDGVIDVVVGNSTNDLLSVFMGASGGTAFEPIQNYTTDTSVRGTTVLDLDSDADPDVATANRDGGGHGTLSLLYNDGSGHFSLIETMDGNGLSETAIEAADANGDGILDLFVGALDSQEILVFLGNGNGGMLFHSRTSAGGSPWMIATGDVNGDGFVDVVSANAFEDTAGVLFGDGTGNLSPVSTYPTGAFPLAIDLGDLDGDGDLDLVTSNHTGVNWTLYENSGDGFFFKSRTYFASLAGSCAVLHDRNKDGALDMTGLDERDDLLFLFTNTPLITATEATDTPPTPILHSGYPNPFRQVHHIVFDLGHTSHVSLIVFDLLGRRVRKVTRATLPAGRHTLDWHGKTDDGHTVPSGAYFYRLNAGNRWISGAVIKQ